MIEIIIDLIYKKIDEFNSNNEIERHILKDVQTPLYGDESKFDSLSMANFIISLEQAINNTFNIEIDLADENAVSHKRNIFLNVNSLAQYIESLLNDKISIEANI